MLTTYEEGQASGVPSNIAAGLSKREREVFSLIVEGYTNKDIAARLFISENTARNHVSHILHKLRLTRRGQAAAFGSQPDAPLRIECYLVFRLFWLALITILIYRSAHRLRAPA